MEIKSNEENALQKAKLIVDTLNTPGITREEMAILINMSTLEEMKIISRFIKNYSVNRKNIDALNFIARQGTLDKMEQIYFACLNINFNENRELIELIALEETKERMFEMRLACETPGLNEDMLALYLIHKQADHLRMRIMRLACENYHIRGDIEALQLINSGSTWLEMNEIRRACIIPDLRSDKDLLRDIVGDASDWKTIKSNLDAYEISHGIDKETFKLYEREAAYNIIAKLTNSYKRTRKAI